MSRYLMRRIAAISAAILVAALALALWRAQFDVEREERGAAEVARMLDELNALNDAPAKDLATHIDALAQINRSPSLRHLQLRLADASGRDLIEPTPTPEGTGGLGALFSALTPGIGSARPQDTGSWTIRRADGQDFLATLQLNPQSEQNESRDNIIGMLVVLVGFALAMLLAVYWTLKRALSPLKAILASISEFEGNNFTHRLPRFRTREMDTIAGALNLLADALGNAEAARRRLGLKLLTSQEDERARIARELHDEFGQALTAMRADALWLVRQTADVPTTRAVASELAGHCERLHIGIRDLLRQLRPREIGAGLGAVSLESLLNDLVQSWRARPAHGVDIVLHYDVDDARVPADLALTLYRLTQEAMTNAIRHAQASHIGIDIIHSPRGIEWRFEDDGVGIDSTEAAVQRGNGLAGMRERVWAHSGELDIETSGVAGARRGSRLRARFAENVPE